MKRQLSGLDERFKKVNYILPKCCCADVDAVLKQMDKGTEADDAEDDGQCSEYGFQVGSLLSFWFECVCA
ncbi:hypothetical protein [Bacillus sp. KH172YL63]|uniref:hypothetical protein n=1 Tax=Bacillus sp. KH172YL63 TaxID=2709784 RepID=UPI0013E4CB64|nr:hypothetical protein [Bacillus sp. KH172YL63]BCB04001.1 hypothetical protein KH172YL63_21340 [Bacillus sp. KH172YL63]